MGPLSFQQAINFYFSNILNVVMFIQYFLFSVSLVLLTLPKRIDRKAILWSLLRFSLLYLAFIFGESIFFALSYMTGTTTGGLLFTASFAIFPIIFLVPNVKDYPLHKIVKISVMVASLMITAEIGRLLGMMVPTNGPDDVSFLLVLARCSPMLFMPLIGFVLYKFNITRFKHLPKVHIIMILLLSALLVASSIWQNALEIEENSERFLLVFIATVELAVLVGLYYAVYYLIESRHRITELEVSSSVLSLEKDLPCTLDLLTLLAFII